MTNLTNFNRDCLWLGLSPFVSYNLDTPFNAPEGRVDPGSTYYTQHAELRSTANATPTVTAGNCSILATMFAIPQEPYEDQIPFRVRGYHGAEDPNLGPYLFWGWGYNGGVAGDVVTIEGANFFPHEQGAIDEAVMVRHLANEDRGLVFFAGIGESTGQRIHTSLAIQNLAIGPDRFSVATW